MLLSQDGGVQYPPRRCKGGFVIDQKRNNVHVSETAGDNEAIVADHGLAGGPDSLLAVGRERNVGAAGVFSVQGPFGLAMADDEDAGRRHFVCLT
jgi:hypothetical protein